MLIGTNLNRNSLSFITHNFDDVKYLKLNTVKCYERLNKY
jgi:hypothetical protein